MLNERIKEQRILHGLNQVELAKKLGVSKQSVSNWENDNIQPSIDMLIRISHFFSVSTDYLLGEDNRKYIEVSNLSKRELRHIQYIIDDMANAKKDSRDNSLVGWAPLVLFLSSYIPLFILIIVRQCMSNTAYLHWAGISGESFLCMMKYFGMSILCFLLILFGLVGTYMTFRRLEEIAPNGNVVKLREVSSL